MADPNAVPPAPPAPNPLANTFNAQRSQALQAANQGAQEGSDAVNRRLSAMGQLNSGVGIQAQNENQAQGQLQKQQAVQGINNQEAQMGQQQNQFDQQMGLQNKQFEQQSGLQNKQFEAGRADTAFNQGMAGKEFDRDTRTTNFNQDVVAYDHGAGINLLQTMDPARIAQYFNSIGRPDQAQQYISGQYQNNPNGTLESPSIMQQNKTNAASNDAMKRALMGYRMPNFGAKIF